MNRGLAILIVVLGAALIAWLFVLGGSARLTAWAVSEQQSVQSALAGALRAVKRGEAWAWVSLIGLCFSYGFFHAAGPGHGKLVIGGYALGSTASRGRVVLITLAGSFGQALTAIILVSIGALVLGLSRTQMVALADEQFAFVSALAICGVGGWLALRGVLRLLRTPAHSHSHNCCHSHGPSPEQIASMQNWRDSVAIVLAIAARPCTGALFVLIITYAMGIWFAGILGVLAMSLGTSLVTLGVGLSAFGLRLGLSDSLQSRFGMALIEIAAGAMICLISAQLALRLLS